MTAVNNAVTAIQESFRGLIVLALLLVLALTLFVPTQGATAVQVVPGLLALLGFVIRDYFASKQAQDDAKSGIASIG